MHSSSVFLKLVVVMFAINGAVSLPMSKNNNQTPISVKTFGDKTVVFNCNVNQDLHISSAIKALETKMERLIALVNKTSTTQPTKPPAVLPSSCKEHNENYQSSKSQVHLLRFGSQKIPVCCHMGNFGCSDGGWTLAMKIDGTKRTFHYDSHFWSDRNAYKFEGGKTGFDQQKTKLPTYWNTPFSKICLSMKIGHRIKFLVINKHANSLYSLIANGYYQPTSLGRHTWKTLIGSQQASLQSGCNKEGFNAVCTYDKAPAKVRIGILGNNEDDCVTCDSRIGFGMAGIPGDVNICGNETVAGVDNGDKHLMTFGYVLVQ